MSLAEALRTGCVAHRLDERLSTLESRLAEATPEARALVQAAVEASVTPLPHKPVQASVEFRGKPASWGSGASPGLVPTTTMTNEAPQ
jgi:hypothetical protein